MPRTSYTVNDDPVVYLTQTEAEELHTALSLAIGRLEGEAMRLATVPAMATEAAFLVRHVATLRAYWAALQEAHSI